MATTLTLEKLFRTENDDIWGFERAIGTFLISKVLVSYSQRIVKEKKFVESSCHIFVISLLFSLFSVGKFFGPHFLKGYTLGFY